MDPRPRSNRETSSGWPLVALGGLSIVGGIYHYSAGAVAFGLILISTPTIVLYLLKLSVRGLSIRRSAPESAFEGDTVEVSVTLSNRSRIPVFHPEIIDVFGPEQHDEKRVFFPDRIRGHETVGGTYSGDCILPRGIYKVGPLRVAVSDPFGWFRVEKALKDPERIKVYPQVLDFGKRDELGRCLTDALSEMTYQGPGESDDFFAVREYRRGDPLRRVHWPLTAHRGFPIVKEFARHSRGDLSIIIDRNREGLVGIGRGSSLEHAVKITAAFSAHSLTRGHRVEVLSGVEDEDNVPAGGGRDYLKTILELLVRVRLRDKPSFDQVVDLASERVRRGSVVLIMVSPYLYYDRSFIKRLERIKARGSRVIAVVFDDSTFRKVWSEEDLSRGEDSMRFVARLKDKGINAYVVPCAADMKAVFAEAPL
ncbi:MAG: DUF58 domain-containing protein [Planctomycetota bacterium]